MMTMGKRSFRLSALVLVFVSFIGRSTQALDFTPLKQTVIAGVDQRSKLVQEMVDSIFSFAEPGFQEFQTSEYITAILAANGFDIEMGISGIPTAWKATKAYFVRDGLFDDVDATIFTHVGRDLNTSWGDSRNNGMVSVEYTFQGSTSHGADETEND